MNWKNITLGLAALGLLACLDRNYHNPFMVENRPDISEAWKADRDGDGIADSVHFYEPGCDASPLECLNRALAKSRIAKAVGEKTGSGDSAGPVDDPVKPPKPPAADSGVFEKEVSVSQMTMTVGDPPLGPDIDWKPADVTNRGYTLESSHPEFLLVVSEGGMDKCKPIAPGEATITLKTAGRGLVTTFKAKVMAPPLITIPVLAISAEDMTLDLGSARSPMVAYTPELATHKAYSLESDKPGIVSVSGYTLRAVAGGRASITITSADGPSSTFDVTVKIPVASVSAPDLILENGATTTPSVKILPADADNRAYTLTSSDSNTVTVNGAKITAKGIGSAAIIISAADGGKAGAFAVKVVLSQKEKDEMAAADKAAADKAAADKAAADKAAEEKAAADKAAADKAAAEKAAAEKAAADKAAAEKAAAEKVAAEKAAADKAAAEKAAAEKAAAEKAAAEKAAAEKAAAEKAAAEKAAAEKAAAEKAAAEKAAAEKAAAEKAAAEKAAAEKAAADKAAAEKAAADKKAAEKAAAEKAAEEKAAAEKSAAEALKEALEKAAEELLRPVTEKSESEKAAEQKAKDKSEREAEKEASKKEKEEKVKV